MQKKWNIKSSRGDAAERLAKELGIGTVTAGLLADRVGGDSAAARRFLGMEEEMLHSPMLLCDMDRAVARIEKALAAGERIVMISVHQNFYPTRTSRGGQVFYRSGNESGQKLAEGIQKQFNDLYGEQGVRQRTAATGDYYMLKCTDYTSVIAECGFLSNSKDEALLVTEAFQESIAQAIYAGLADYLAAVSGA